MPYPLRLDATPMIHNTYADNKMMSLSNYFKHRFFFFSLFLLLVYINFSVDFQRIVSK